MTSEAQDPEPRPNPEENANHGEAVAATAPPCENSTGEPSQPDGTGPIASETLSESATSSEPATAGSSERRSDDAPSSSGGGGSANAVEQQEEEDGKDNDTDATAESAGDEIAKRGVGVNGRVSSLPIVSTSKKNRPPYKYDPSKITLRFLFANRDGLTVTIECEPSDTIGEIKSSLLSVWPRDVPDCTGIESLRLVCMGKGFLSPDTKTLEECQIPTFKTHPTPVNVSLKPDQKSHDDVKKKGQLDPASSGSRTPSGAPATNAVSQGCSCVVL